MYRSGRTEVVRTMYRNGHVPNWSYPDAADYTRSLSTAARYRNQQSRSSWQQNGESQALLSENGQTVSKQLSLLTNACLKSTVYCSDILILIHCIVMSDGGFLMDYDDFLLLVVLNSAVI